MAFDNPEFLAKLRKAFQNEAKERLSNLGKAIIGLEGTDDQTAREGMLELAYRETHSLKGAGRAVGAFDVEVISHAMETVFSRMMKTESTPDESLLDTLLHAVDMLHFAVKNSMENESASPDAIRLAAQLTHENESETQDHSFADILTPMSEEELGTPKPSTPYEEISERDIPTYSEIEATPAPTPQTQEIQDCTPQPTTATAPPKSEEQKPVATKTQAQSPTQCANERELLTIRVPSKRLEDVLLHGEEMLWLKSAMDKTARRLNSLKEEMTGLKLAITALHTHQSDSKNSAQYRERSENVRRHLDFIDAEIGSLTHISLKNSRAMTTMLDDLLDETRRILLEPFSTLFDMLPIIARDIAREQGKKCRLSLIGSQVEIDRRILDELRDVFVHIIRNAVDHGIETPEKRLAKGKIETGRIQVRVARSLGGKARIDVSDDGHGLDPDAIAAKAVALNVLSADTARELSPQEKMNLIFHSGLSTSPLITDISGRGLGLAIAKDKVEHMGGSIAVSSEAGKGTQFDIILPSALSSYSGIVVVVAGRYCVIPKGGVERVIRIKPDDIIEALSGKGIVYKGQTIPLHRLQTILELPESDLSPTNTVAALIMTAAGRHAAVVVDEIHEEREVMAKRLGPQLRRVRHIAAVATLSGGVLAPILHISDIVATAFKTNSTGMAKKRHQAVRDKSKKQPIVLVAEDSITSRMLLKNILEAAGYIVKTAIDGVEAFLTLRETAPDIVITDVQMPGMDGFELTTRIRSDSAFSNLPVILVTSLETREDKERGIDAGADAYIVKSGFDQKNLLDVIERLL